MADTYFNNGLRSSFNTDIYKAYWDEILDDTYINRNPLTTIMVKLGQVEFTPSLEFNWVSYKEKLRSVTGVDMGSPSSGVATLTVGSGEGEQIAKGSILHDENTGSSYYVTAVTSRASDQVSVQKITESGTTYGTITADETNGHTLYIDAMSVPDAWSDIANITDWISQKQDEKHVNYIQDFTEYTYMSEYAANEQRWINGSRRDQLKARAMQRLMDRVEISLFRSNGGTYNTVSWSGNEGDTAMYFAKGIDGFGIQTETAALSSYTWKDWRDFVHEKIMLWNDKPVVNAFCNYAMFNKIDEWVADSTELNWAANNSSGSELGWAVKSLTTSLCTVNLWSNLALRDGYSRTNAIMYALDLDRLCLRYYNGDQDSFYMKIISDPERAQKDHRRTIIDEINTKCAIQVQSPERHAKLTLNG